MKRFFHSPLGGAIRCPNFPQEVWQGCVGLPYEGTVFILNSSSQSSLEADCLHLQSYLDTVTHNVMSLWLVIFGLRWKRLRNTFSNSLYSSLKLCFASLQSHSSWRTACRHFHLYRDKWTDMHKLQNMTQGELLIKASHVTVTLPNMA